MTIPDEKFPLIGRILELVQVKSNQIIEEETLDLTSEDVKFRAEDA